MSSPASERPPASTLVWTGIWFAMLASLVEVTFLVVRRLDDSFIHRSRDFLWMTPTGYLILLALPMLLLWLLYRGTRLPFHLGVFLLATGTAGAALLVLFGGKLHPAAILLLGLGVGFQTARMAQGHPGRFQSLMRRTAPWMLGLLLLVGAGTVARRYWSERRAVAGLPQSVPGAKNIVLIILDTVRAASLGLYGYPQETTPELDRWARRGVVFDRAIATAPWTLPSHASMFTGRLPHELSADWLTPLDNRWPTLAESLRDQGYRTGGFVANMIYATWEHGLDRGFVHYEDYPFSLGMLLRHTVPGRRLTDARTLRQLIGTDELVGRKSAGRIGQDFLNWLDDDPSRPFFAFLNYYDAHDPYLPPEDFFRKFAGHPRRTKLSPLRRGGPFARQDRLSAEDLQVETAGYDGAIAYLDSELGKLFGELERRGILDRTLVIVTSDHGEEFGEHGVFFHGHTLYRQSLHVPLLMLGPVGIPAGRRITQTVSLGDLAATVTDLLALSDGFPGQSLRRFWTDSTAADEPALSMVSQGIRIPEWYPAAHNDLKSIVANGIHYIHGKDEMVFDWRTDPAEQHNLAGTAGAADALTQLRDLLRQTWGSPGGEDGAR